MIDIGANLAHREFSRDRDEVVRYAREVSGIEGIIVTGTSITGKNQRQIMDDLCESRFPNFCWKTVGVHPHNTEREFTQLRKTMRVPAKRESASDIEIMRAALEAEATRSPKTTVAIGETGLDYARSFSFGIDQKRAFEAHLEVARKLGLPLFLHERDAFEDFVDALDADAEKPSISSAQDRGVVHCFSGGEREARAYLSRGLMLGISGIVCMPEKGRAIRSALADGAIPLDRIMVETDAPYLLPRQARSDVVRASRNEPAALPSVVRTVAELLDGGQHNETDVAAACTDNARRLFRIDHK